MSFITILTPTYNRAHTLPKIYECLINQTNQDFTWLIVDDGSVDDTKELINGYISKNEVNIKYIFKENGGKHTAVNMGLDNVDSELTLFLDSDDTLVNDAIKIINEKWNKWRDQSKIGLMFFLQMDSNGIIRGNLFPYDGYISNYNEFRFNKKIHTKDLCFVCRNSYMNGFRFPMIENEYFCGVSTLWIKFSLTFDCVCFNDIIYISEYLNDGISKAGRKLRINNPIGGMLYANELMRPVFKFSVRFGKTILYGTYGFFAKIKIYEILRKSNSTLLCFLCLPFSYVLYIYWKVKYNNSNFATTKIR